MDPKHNWVPSGHGPVKRKASEASIEWVETSAELPINCNEVSNKRAKVGVFDDQRAAPPIHVPGTNIYIYSANRLGRGGFGTVFKGYYREPKHPVAVKCIDGQHAEVFENELSIWEEIKGLKPDCPRNIIPLLDYAMTRSANNSTTNYFFGLELAVHDLSEEIKILANETVERCQHPIRIREKLIGYLKDVAKGIQCLHAHNIIHRDLKPDNILICVSNGEKIAKICDFGLTLKQTNDTQANGILAGIAGTDQWMAPEAIKAGYEGIMIRIQSENIEKIEDFPTPTKKEEVQHFLDMCYHFNNEFSDTYSKCFEPLYNILLANSNFRWGVEEDSAFHELKQVLCRHIVGNMPTRKTGSSDKFLYKPSFDIFALGMIGYNAMTLGEHPFSNGRENRASVVKNIGDSDVQPKSLDEDVLANHLFQWMMLKREEDRRPKIDQVLEHPFFWTSEYSLKFIVNVARAFDKKNDKKVDEIRRRIDGFYNWLQCKLGASKDSSGSSVNWVEGLGSKVFELLQASESKVYDYDPKSAMSLVEMIKDKWSAYQDLKDELLQDNYFGVDGMFNEDKFVRYFLSKFPYLILFLYVVLSKSSTNISFLQSFKVNNFPSIQESIPILPGLVGPAEGFNDKLIKAVSDLFNGVM